MWFQTLSIFKVKINLAHYDKDNRNNIHNFITKNFLKKQNATF